MIVVAEKACTACKEVKPLFEFNIERARKDGHKAQCRPCARAKRRVSGVDRKRYVNNRAKARDLRLRKQYGITLDDYERMLAAQGGVCDLCGEPERGTYKGFPKSLAVDHCHKTGAVRALLCAKCNLAIGGAKDDPSLLRRMADYVEEHAACHSMSFT